MHPVVPSRLSLSSDGDCQDQWLIKEHITTAVVFALLFATVGLIYLFNSLVRKAVLKIDPLIICDENLTENELNNIILTRKVCPPLFSNFNNWFQYIFYYR